MATVRVLSDDNFQTTILAGNHEFMADEPAGIGDDVGPSPYEFVLAGLGACTSMTLIMYAKRKAWPLDGVEIELSHGREYQDDCENCEEPGHQIDVIHRSITLHGQLNDEQRERLSYVATRCPVHQTLTNPPQIVDMVAISN